MTTPRLTKYIPHKPTPKQAAFLLLNCREAFYGGAAGGGKSDALLMAALQYVDVPGYAALLLRLTYADLSLPEALMDRAFQWLGGTDARWSDRTKTWTFPSSATVTFGYMATEQDKYRYKSSAFQFVGFDELTQFTETKYLYLFSRTRRLKGLPVPVRVRGASNPGDIGHQWVFERFVMNRGKRVFIPARLQENPYLDQEEYIRSLEELDDVTRMQLLLGLWVTDPHGKPFKREYWRGKNRYDARDKRLVNSCVARWISWDTGLKDKAENAYTADTVFELLPDYRLLVRQVWRERLLFPDLPDEIANTARRYNQDGKLRGVLIEDKASGTSAYQTLMASAEGWMRPLLVAFMPQGDKAQRAQQAAVWCKRDCVLLPYPSEAVPWLADFEMEIFDFPETQFKDQTDSFVQGIIYLENILAEGWRARNSGPEVDDESAQ